MLHVTHGMFFPFRKENIVAVRISVERMWVVVENRRTWGSRDCPTSADHNPPPFILVMQKTLHACV